MYELFTKRSSQIIVIVVVIFIVLWAIQGVCGEGQKLHQTMEESYCVIVRNLSYTCHFHSTSASWDLYI